MLYQLARGAGIHFILSRGVTEFREKEEELARLLIAGLRSIPGVILYGGGDAGRQIAVVSLNIAGLASSRVALELEEESMILCRPGLHCAPLAHRTIRTFPKGTVRLSLGYFNTKEEVNTVIEAISKIAKVSKAEVALEGQL